MSRLHDPHRIKRQDGAPCQGRPLTGTQTACNPEETHEPTVQEPPTQSGRLHRPCRFRGDLAWHAGPDPAAVRRDDLPISVANARPQRRAFSFVRQRPSALSESVIRMSPPMRVRTRPARILIPARCHRRRWRIGKPVECRRCPRNGDGITRTARPLGREEPREGAVRRPQGQVPQARKPASRETPSRGGRWGCRPGRRSPGRPARRPHAPRMTQTLPLRGSSRCLRC